MVRVKICCNTHEEDVALCVEEGADAVGFVVEYPTPVPWSLPRQRAAALMRGVPPFVSRVAVVGGDADTILRIAEDTAADALQLHGDEAEDVVEAVRAGLEGTSVQVLKALRVGSGEEAAATDWVAEVRRFATAGADAILLDAKSSARAGGGTGATFDWSIARDVSSAGVLPVVLAGGLTPENIARAVEVVAPYAVDVITAVEDERHRKVRGHVRAFVRAARDAGIASAATP